MIAPEPKKAQAEDKHTHVHDLSVHDVCGMVRDAQVSLELAATAFRLLCDQAKARPDAVACFSAAAAYFEVSSARIDSAFDVLAKVSPGFHRPKRTTLATDAGVRITRNAYFLRDGTPTTRQEWANRCGDRSYTQLALARLDTKSGAVDVSTIWLGADARVQGDGPPLIFETLVSPSSPQRIERYSTEAEALLGHDRIVMEELARKVGP